MSPIWLTTLLVVTCYLALVRFVDLNEKEPLWAMALFFLLGAAAGWALQRALPAAFGLRPLEEALASGLGVLGAMGIGLGILALVGRRRGHGEFDGILDGLVYGVTAGLGFGTACQLLAGLTLGTETLPGLSPAPLSSFPTVALRGLVHGIGGAFVGLGFGVAWQVRSPWARAALPLLGLGAGVLVWYGHHELGHADAFGHFGLVRARVALLGPVVVLVICAALGLLREVRTLRRELTSEAAEGWVTPDDYRLITSFARRQAAYLRTLVRLDFARWSAWRRLHQLQVKLAFAKERLAAEVVPARRARTEGEIAHIRARLLLERQKLVQAGTP